MSRGIGKARIEKRALQKKKYGLTGAGGGGFGPLYEGCFDVIVVGEGDYFEFDLFGACGFAFADVGTVGKVFSLHLADHGEGATVAFDLALRQVAEVRDLRSDE